MARKSRWQQFTDSFNSVYGTVTSIGQDFEIAKVNRQDFKDDAGNPLKGLALDRARTKALGDIYTKYGDAEKGISLRSSAELLGANVRDNDIGEATKQEKIFQEGAGASGLLRANVNNTNASAGLSNARTNETNVLLPGKVVGQGLSNSNLQIVNDQARFDLGLDVTTRGDLVRRRVAEANQLEIVNDQARFDLGLDEDTRDATARRRIAEANQQEGLADSATAQGDVDQATVGENITQEQLETQQASTNLGISNSELQELEATSQARIDAALAEAAASIAENENKLVAAEDIQSAKFIASEILAEMTDMDFASDVEADAYFIEEFSRATRGNPASLTIMDTVNKQGIERLLSEATAITEKIREGAENNGLVGALDAYDDVLDGQTGDVRIEGGRTVLYLKDENGNERIFDSETGTGPEVEDLLLERLLARANDPIGMAEVANEQLTRKQAQANLDQTEADTLKSEAQTMETAASADLLIARREEILSNMDGSKTGAAAVQARMDAMVRFMDSPEMQRLMASDDPEDRALAQDATADFERAAGVAGAPPPGIAGRDWYILSDDEKTEIFQLYDEGQ